MGGQEAGGKGAHRGEVTNVKLHRPHVHVVGTSARMDSAAAAQLAGRRHARITVAPAAASALAVSNPMPELAPVTIAVLPSKDPAGMAHWDGMRRCAFGFRHTRGEMCAGVKTVSNTNAR